MLGRYQVGIVGGGLAGHTAAIYAGRAELSTILFEGIELPGGQLTTTTIVENYPGFSKGIDGNDLMFEAQEQSKSVGVIIIHVSIENVDFSERPFKLYTKSGYYLCDSVIICTGSTTRKLDIPGVGPEPGYWQRGVSSCAVCDGALSIFRNKDLYVVGGGDTAMEEAIFLSKFASTVYIVHRRDEFRASKIMVKKVLSIPNIKTLYSHIVIEVRGDSDLMTNIVLKDLKSEVVYEKPAAGLFFAIGHIPNTKFLKGKLDLDEKGYIKTILGTTKTSIEGVFAAGDVQDKVYRQAVVAAGSGCMAALDANSFLCH